MNIKEARTHFPMLRKEMRGKPFVYLDTAATAHKPESVIAAVASFYRDEYATVLRGVYEFAEKANQMYQRARDKAATLLHAGKSDEIVFCRSATEGINTVAYSFGKAFLKRGDTVLITEMEHHSNLVPWQITCEERGAQLVVAPIDLPSGELSVASYLTLLEKFKPKIVAVTHVSNVLGTVNPIKMLAAAAHSVGAKILVDGAQAVPHFPVDVQELGADFYVFSGHKLYGPTGVGILYGREELLDAMPPHQSGGSMVDTVTFEKTTYNALPWKFEAGTMMLAEIIGLAAAIDFIQEIGFSSIMEWENKLINYALEGMKAFPAMTVYGQPKQREGVIAFNVEGIHPLDLGTWCDLQGVALRTGNHCAQPLLRKLGVSSTARLSIGLYNTFEDIDIFLKALASGCAALRG